MLSVPPDLMAIVPFLKCIVSANMRLGTNFAPPTVVSVTVRGVVAAKAGTATAAATTATATASPTRACLRPDIGSFLTASHGGVGGPGTKLCAADRMRQQSLSRHPRGRTCVIREDDSCQSASVLDTRVRCRRERRRMDDPVARAGAEGADRGPAVPRLVGGQGPAGTDSRRRGWLRRSGPAAAPARPASAPAAP